MDDSKRRDFSRVPVAFAVTIEADDGQVIESTVSRDVSMKGLFVVTNQRLPAGTGCQVTIQLDAQGGNHRIGVAGHVARINDEGLAVEFSEIPIDDYDHLRNLVLFNSEDVDRIEEEFDEHLGLQKKADRDG